MEKKRCIGVLGPMGSGKGIAAKYISKRYGYKQITMSNTLRAIARREKIKPTRQNLEELQARYRKKYGEDFMINAAIKRIGKSKAVVIDGMRTQIDAKLAKQKLGAVLIAVDALPEIRFKRMKKRHRTGFDKTFEHFKKTEAKENKIFKFHKTMALADYKVNNDDGLKQMYSQLDKLMKKINN